MMFACIISFDFHKKKSKSYKLLIKCCALQIKLLHHKTISANLHKNVYFGRNNSFYVNICVNCTCYHFLV